MDEPVDIPATRDEFEQLSEEIEENWRALQAMMRSGMFPTFEIPEE